MFSSGVVDALISLHCQSVKRYLNQNHHYMKWIVWLYMYIMMSLEVTFLQCFPLAKEHLHSMGIPQWPIPGSTDPFPVFSYKPPRTVSKRLAGNVTWLWTSWNHIKRLRSGWFFAIVTVIATVEMIAQYHEGLDGSGSMRRFHVIASLLNWWNMIIGVRFGSIFSV